MSLLRAIVYENNRPKKVKKNVSFIHFMDKLILFHTFFLGLFFFDNNNNNNDDDDNDDNPKCELIMAGSSRTYVQSFIHSLLTRF